MAEFPTYEQMAKEVAEKALDGYSIDGKTLREWIKIIEEQESKTETVTEFADRCRECGARYGRLLQQERKTGHWIYTLEDWNKWECSECGFTKRTDVHITLGYKYCPNCGAKMESEDE